MESFYQEGRVPLWERFLIGPDLWRATEIQSGLPVWGTCAGMILLAKELVNDSVTHLGVMDIAVRRNAYGSQIDSFATKKVIPAVDSKEIELVFIRAPYITSVKDGVKILCELDGHIVAAEERICW